MTTFEVIMTIAASVIAMSCFYIALHLEGIRKSLNEIRFLLSQKE